MDPASSPSLTLALAMACGVFTQAIARHAYVPGIVLLLAVGVGLGPDGVGLIQPAALGGALPAIVSFGVAVILFEGGLRLELRVLREQAVAIRRLVSVGALVTAAGGALACHVFMGWDWRLCVLFGTLVIVTGPTVVTPLVRRIGLPEDLGTILEAEGVFIDAIGATVAVVALEIAIAPSGAALGAGVGSIALRFATGGLVGLAGGLLLALLLRWRRIVPRGLENVLTLSVAIAIFHLSDAIVAESGITAAIVAGIILGNMHSYALGEIADFKEQLTVLLVATLFVLLAADVRLADVLALGSGGVFTVLALMFVVRPAAVFASTIRTGLSVPKKLFVSWCAPRGIIAAAVASLFAIELAHAEVEGGVALRALVFLVIAITVTAQGLTGGLVARLLGVRTPRDVGYVLLGANPLALHLATRLSRAGEPIVFIDSNVDASRAARELGYEVLRGNGLDERTLLRANISVRRGCIALTPNESINLLFARRVMEDFPGPKVYVAVEADSTGVTAEMVEKIDARILFGGARRLHDWIRLWERGRVELVRWEYAMPTDGKPATLASAPRGVLLPLVIERGDSIDLVDDASTLRAGDVIELAIDSASKQQAMQWLEEAGGQLAVPVATAGDEQPSA